MSPVATGILIDAPAPRPPLYTLIGAAEVVPLDEPEHDVMGVQVRGYPCDVSHAWDWLNHTGNKVVAGAQANPSFRGVTIYMVDTCNTRGVSPDVFRQRAADLFAAVEAYGVEREFWTGEILNAGGAPSGTPSLVSEIPVPGATDATVFPAANAVQTLIEGVALLEAAIAATGRRGMIHMSPTAFTHLVRSGTGVVSQARQNPAQLQTMLGTILVPGYGYQKAATVFEGSTPVAPVGHPLPTGTQEWMFATGLVQIRRGPEIEITPAPDQLDQAIDRVNNLLTYEVSRPYVWDWDACFKAAVLVDRAT
jgi:hypothetical protein